MPKRALSSNITLSPNALKSVLALFNIGFYAARFTKGVYVNSRYMDLGFRISMYTLDITLNPVILWEYMRDEETGRVYKRGIMLNG